ncbi:DinB superfamily protein [Adhaeretor mobilis]|uniref:DinB superfamily protein n=2 Tax=Adhaeretor mobilis TaxID=1930276 RepID=A0A517MZZ2_9BACT|nr:DinB superfamily protein [Adhaeretor mobilis]
MRETIVSYRCMIDATIEQLTDEELFARPAPTTNSVAIILRHLGGNLRSRWTDFLTTDGEKPDRNRDTEFLDWDGDRQSLIVHFDSGWGALATAIESLDDDNLGHRIQIRGESHTIPQAITRSVAHITYHVGQIAIVARLVHKGEWQWLTVAPGNSSQFNEQTWGTAGSRSIFSKDDNAG